MPQIYEREKSWKNWHHLSFDHHHHFSVNCGFQHNKKSIDLSQVLIWFVGNFDVRQARISIINRVGHKDKTV